MITMNSEKLWIAAQFMSTEQTRYYLCGVFIEPCADGGLTITATDGHRLVSCYDQDGLCAEPLLATITKDTIKALKKADIVTIDDNKQLSTSQNEQITYIQPGSCEIDGTFPDWRHVVSSTAEITGEQSIGFNAKYLGQFQALHGFSKQTVITVYSNGDKPTIVSTGNPDVFALLMPMTNENATSDVPSWIGLPRQEEKAA